MAEASRTLDAATVQDLVQKLENVTKTQELLLKALVDSGTLPSARLTQSAIRRNTISSAGDVESFDKDAISASFIAEDSDSEQNESIFVRTPLPTEVYTVDGLRKHLREFDFPEDTIKVLGTVLNEETLSKELLFPIGHGAQEDRSHLSHYSIYDVGVDGAPLEVRSAPGVKDQSRSLSIWNKIKEINADPNKERQAVGRITIVREPSPMLFAALHYTLHKHFDIDELYQFMVDDGPELIHPHRAFDEDIRKQRSFVFTMEYFTVIGDDCQPMTWQLADENRLDTESHVPISRCSAVVGLSLLGEPVSKVKNKDRYLKKGRRVGNVYDPFAPWHVCSITAYPDWMSSVDTFDSTKHFVNGTEAFLVALKQEYHDARKRLTEVYEKVSDMVEPPNNFIFSSEVRDKLLFEDKNFTYSRRYFWAYQTLDIMNQDIHEMVMAYKDTFKDSVWCGRNKTLWPGEESVSSRYAQWRKRLHVLRREFEFEVAKLEEIQEMNDKKMKGIKSLRDNLFSGTSVMESRRSVEMAETTVAQGRNIQLLTLVTIFFLPLTFVTSVFGMTNMDPNQSFKHFAWSTVAICVPTYLLIGSLNTNSGLTFWTDKTRLVTHSIGDAMAWTLDLFNYRPAWTNSYHNRGMSTEPMVPVSWAAEADKRGPRYTEGISHRRTFSSYKQPLSPTTQSKLERQFSKPQMPERKPTSPQSPTVRFDDAIGSGSSNLRPRRASTFDSSYFSNDPKVRSPTQLSMRSRETTPEKDNESDTQATSGATEPQNDTSIFSRFFKTRKKPMKETKELDSNV